MGLIIIEAIVFIISGAMFAATVWYYNRGKAVWEYAQFETERMKKQHSTLQGVYKAMSKRKQSTWLLYQKRNVENSMLRRKDNAGTKNLMVRSGRL